MRHGFYKQLTKDMCCEAIESGNLNTLKYIFNCCRSEKNYDDIPRLLPVFALLCKNPEIYNDICNLIKEHNLCYDKVDSLIIGWKNTNYSRVTKEYDINQSFMTIHQDKKYSYIENFDKDLMCKKYIHSILELPWDVDTLLNNKYANIFIYKKNLSTSVLQINQLKYS